ncbi:sortase, SrtB family [Pseudoramibacter alactolyticus ATCC 23263]|uniref:Sortase, SrtB family n=1 Tax=Pseudoramibacter alactolyticus ATCC 23263 TaxID=887929 RepID=E6MJT4_9FIRM|nr:class B sortase [Pseudoramibacter alactolyticus]EFV00673.1 sortase, SrtB family [Pseudoramibacter alactolyticus ATCC 23263]MBM6967392.1 class B sortase [Pseudoramibacter alactolyticus]
MKKWLYRLVMLICIGVMIYSGYQLFKIYRSYHQGTTAYQKTASTYTKKSDNTKVPISVDFDALKKQNPDVIGWLYCKDTPINYPVVKGADNSEYLHKLFDGTHNAAGTLFADYRSKGDFSDPNTIIYGHAMKNGSMFGMLAHYKKGDYYKAHPFMWLLTPNGNYRLDLIAGFSTASDNMIYSAMDSGQVQAAIYQAKKKSTFASTVDTSQVTRIVTLSTCAYEYEEARYVVLTVPVRVD